jgi:hypothetical protein
VRARGIFFSSLTLLYLTLPVSPCSGVTRSEQDAGPQNSKQASAAVTVLQPDNSETRVHSTLAQEVEKSTSGWWLVWLTAALVGVGAAQCLVFCWQGSQLRRTVKTMDSTAIRQLRAYVLVAGGEIKFPNPGTPEAQLVLRNFGQTPAHNVRVWIHMWIERYPLRVGLPTPPADFRMATSILPPGGHTNMFIPKEPPVPSQAIHLLGTPAGTIYVYGEIQYVDVFQITRSTKYRLIYGGPEGARDGRMSHDAEGKIAT